jgi:hypothetical protein
MTRVDTRQRRPRGLIDKLPSGMRVSADLDDVDATLDERGWRRTTDWEPVRSGYLATVEQTGAQSNEAPEAY